MIAAASNEAFRPVSRNRSLENLADASHVAEMCDAAVRDDPSEILRLIDMKASASACDYDNRTPLHLAACSGSLNCAKLLVKHGAELTQDRFGCLPIHDAVRYGHTDVARYLRDLPISACDLRDQDCEESYDAKKSSIFGMIIREGIFSLGTVQAEIDAFFNLGLHAYYYKHFTLLQISRHIHALVAAKCTAVTTASEHIHFTIEEPNTFFAITTSDHSRSTELAAAESLSNALFNKPPEALNVHMICTTSSQPAVIGGKSPLSVYSIEYEPFRSTAGCQSLLNEDQLDLIATNTFIRNTSREKKQLFQRLMSKLLDYKSSIISVRPVTENDEVQILFCSYEIAGKTYVAELWQNFRAHKCLPILFQIESFANGSYFYTMTFPSHNMRAVHEVARTMATIPFLASSSESGRRVMDLAMKATITFGHAQFLIVFAKFCFHFYPKETPEYIELSQKFKDDAQSQAKLDELYLKTMGELLQEEKIFEVLAKEHAITRKIYDDFKAISAGTKEPFYNKEIAAEIERTFADQTTREILLQGLLFNSALLTTNTFKGEEAWTGLLPCFHSGPLDGDGSTRKSSVFMSKDMPRPECDSIDEGESPRHGSAISRALPAALAYRLDPSFIAKRNRHLYPEVPYAMFLIIGRGFYGFHVRFRDVSRGGIRIIRSRNDEVHKINASRLFEEGYNLAYTQQKKNKDIPEGGSKGTILLDVSHQSPTAMRACFLDYIDSLLDLMLCEDCKIFSHLKQPDMLFFGPDENTAGFMDLGAKRAKRRGYPYWKAITTGKSTELGGIPHDTYGMTTNSVHMYTLGLLEALGINEEDITKVQTGGPDGDLGSNEILISKDKTIVVIDGSGVLYDPSGLDRPELCRLAKLRVPVMNFDRAKLGRGGFLVTVDETDITLPDGTLVKHGIKLRDTFHLSKYATADLFVPCGGRPNAVHAGNVSQMLNDDGKPKFKYIVEGANLFFTNDARMVMEGAGVKCFKDASTNKGGVTSSSLEVFASLAMGDKDHSAKMTVALGKEPPKFYKQYVECVLEVVKRNALCEFKEIWKMMEAGVGSSDATDRLSQKINDLTDTIFREICSQGMANNPIVEKTLRRAIPQVLQDEVGIDAIMKNTPENYLMAIVATFLASRYVYEKGIDSSEYNFFLFMNAQMQ